MPPFLLQLLNNPNVQNAIPRTVEFARNTASNPMVQRGLQQAMTAYGLLSAVGKRNDDWWDHVRLQSSTLHPGYVPDFTRDEAYDNAYDLVQKRQDILNALQAQMRKQGSNPQQIKLALQKELANTINPADVLRGAGVVMPKRGNPVPNSLPFVEYGQTLLPRK